MKSQNENRVDANVKSVAKKLCEQSKLIPTVTRRGPRPVSTVLRKTVRLLKS